MKRRPGLSSRPIEFMPRRFYFVITREVVPCSLDAGKSGNGGGSTVTSANKPAAPNSFQSSMRSLFPRTAGIQFISLHDQLPRPSSARNSNDGGADEDDEDDEDDEFDLGILQTLRFNDFLTRILTSTASSRPSPSPSEPHTGNGINAIHQCSPHYFFVRRERLAEVVKAIHLICRWRLLYLGLSPQEALAPFEHLPFLLSSFFAPHCRFQPPNLLGSLTGIAKGIAGDLLVHTNMEPWWLIGRTASAAGDEAQHDSGAAGEECTDIGSEAMPMLVPISRRFVVCQSGWRHHRIARGERDDGKKSDNLRGDDVPVGHDDDTQATADSVYRQTQLLVSHLKNSNIALTIVLCSDGPGGDCNSDNRLDDSSATTLLASLASSGLAILNISAPLGAPPDTLADSTDGGNAGAYPSTAASLSATDELVIERFLDACEQTPGTIAVSSASSFAAASTDIFLSASSISAATCIGCYLMKHHGFTSQEAVGWIRYCWPEVIPLARQLFLDHMQPRMWRDGEQFRQRLRQRQQRKAAESAMMLADSSASRLSSQISIGRISLGRDSLFGTKTSERSDIGDRDGDQYDRPHYDSLHRHHQSHLSLHQHLQSSQQNIYGENGTDEDSHVPEDEHGEHHTTRSIPAASSFVASQSAVGKQRRPLTQGSAISARRLHRPSDGTGFARADFSLLHKFVHQTAVPRSGQPSSSNDGGSRAAASSTGHAGLAVGSAMAAAVARISTAENAALTRRTADVST